MWCILMLTRPRAEENFSLEQHESDSTKSQHFFLNLEFCVKILEYDKHRVHCFFSGRILTKHFSKTKNADCHLKVNQFQEWIQAFWKFLNQNSAFSRSTNIHHFSTSLWRNVATWGLWYVNIFVDFFSH